MKDIKRPASGLKLSPEELRRRKREGIIIVVVVLVVALLTVVENRVIHFGADIPVSNTILMFILININLLLLILLIFLVFRNLVKLLYDRRRKVLGARLRTRLAVAFIALTLLPTTVLFFFSINFITTSIEFWFNVPVEQALENSLQVGQGLYERVEANSRFFLERIAYQVDKKKLLTPDKHKFLSRYIKISQREFNLEGVEIYDNKSNRLTFAVDKNLEKEPLSPVSADDLQKALEGDVSTVSEVVGVGELLRTVGRIPTGSEPAEVSGYVMITTIIPPRVSRNMHAISRGFEEYQQIKLLKKPIQITYYITLSIVALLVVFCAIWFGFYMAKTITIPIMELVAGTRRVAEGDLQFRIDLAADDEIGSLVEAFNKMTQDLQAGHEQLELSARILREQNIEIEERRRYMEIVVNNVSAGVLTLDAHGYTSTINKSAERMLNLKSEDIFNRDYRQLLRGRHLRLAEQIMEQLRISPDEAVELPIKLIIAGRPRSFLISVNALHNEAGDHLGIVMVFDDLTELEKAQRMAAWREVARRIAHEVKNPLTPITLSAQRLKRKYSAKVQEPVFDECIRMIVDHVDLIRNLVNEFSSFARFPTADPKPCDLPPIVEETVALYREGHPDVHFEIRNSTVIPRLNVDRQQIKQAMINLVDNAIAAIRGEGRIVISMRHNSETRRVFMEVCDDGAGISDEDKVRLFEPNFSTKKTGMGLGLTIVNTIVVDHNGRISVRDNTPQGARFIIELPA